MLRHIHQKDAAQAKLQSKQECAARFFTDFSKVLFTETSMFSLTEP